MYNVFKRPMFKLGGQADQGTGIMSTVEPRINYMFGTLVQPLTPFQNTYTDLPAYAYGGRIGYQNAGSVLPGTLPDDPFKKFAPTNIPKAGVAKIESKPSIDYLIESGYLPQLTPGRRPTARDIINAERKFEKDRSELMSKTYEQQAATEERAGFGRTQPTVIPKKPTTTEATTTDPREEIRKEAAVLKDLLKDKGLTTAENSFIIAKALSTPGGFNEKIQAAANLAMPIIKERSKLDRELVLKAYERRGEIEKAKIAAGKKDAAAQFEEDIVNTRIRQAVISGDVQIGEDGIKRYKTPGSDKFRTSDEIRSEVQTLRLFGGKVIENINERIDELQRRINTLKTQKNQPIDTINKLESEIEKLKLRKERGFNMGGRVEKQLGGMMNATEDIITKEAEETNEIIDTNVAGTPMRPVKKLTYEEIRNRLPKEITDDIVVLITNSAEALQDFAYIRTQEDVNRFNVKYGVNLVLPQGV